MTALAMLEKEALVRLTGVPAAADGPKTVNDIHLFPLSPLIRLLSPPLTFLLVWVAYLLA